MDPERWKQVDELLQQALERPADEREEFLRRACGGDEALEREIRSLLASHQEAGSFLENPAADAARQILATEPSLTGAPSPSLKLGTMVGHYCLSMKIGEGGMGEVYRARDTKLQRDVALKILPQAMARDAERMARFEREAQVLASLNHPNIAAIYGIEESNGIRALAMELVEGETLTYKNVGEGSALPREPKELPYDEALPIAKQIAEALEYAHERGVIHRDLKPANVKITPEGTAKVLDFGLAKVINPQDSIGAVDPANSPTLATKPGTLLGTTAYMSPEQAKGRQVDRRCDIWAFGCVLYEMLSGRKAFEGETISDVLAAVIRADPNLDALPDTTPASIQRLIRRCLQKDVHQRLQAIGDARITIEETISGTGVRPVVEREQDAHVTRPQRRALPWVVAAASILAAAAILLLRP
ncbi:MAG TPA: serine/threonine-protein kinase, partial [Terriglobia bacterium]|nr:serine/threonine-protein kinase [Terriglobia bacterium]